MAMAGQQWHRDGDENPEFSRWWQSWPKEHRIAKGAARREWMKLRPTPQQAEQWTQAVELQAQSRKWREGYVVAPARWLHDERWDDYVEPVPKQTDRCSHTPVCPNPSWCMVLRARERGEAI